MIKDQERLMLDKGLITHGYSINQALMYERLIAEKYSDFKANKQNTVDQLKDTVEMISHLFGLLITTVGANNAHKAWDDVLEHSLSKYNDGMAKRGEDGADFRAIYKRRLETKLQDLIS